MEESRAPRWLTVRQVAAAAGGVCIDTVYHWIRSGELEALNVAYASAPRYRVSSEALRRFMDGRRAAAVQPDDVRRQGR